MLNAHKIRDWSRKYFLRACMFCAGLYLATGLWSADLFKVAGLLVRIEGGAIVLASGSAQRTAVVPTLRGATTLFHFDVLPDSYYTCGRRSCSCFRVCPLWIPMGLLLLSLRS